jgi:uncharacterized protein
MLITMAGFAFFLAYRFVPKFTPYSFTQLAAISASSPADLIKVAILLQGFLSIFMFLMPALVFAHLAHPDPLNYLGLRRPGKWIQLLLVIFIMLGAMPVLQKIEELISLINFGEKVKESQKLNDDMMSAMLRMPTVSAFIRSFVIMAILPAAGEELFFRGVFLRLVKQKSRTMALPIIMTAAIFSYSHTNVYGYLSIFLAGVLLAVIYNLTGSLWCSMLAHLFFNGFQVAFGYFAKDTGANGNATTPLYLVAAGALMFSISFYLLLRNKTPLPADWANDFAPGEPANTI